MLKIVWTDFTIGDALETVNRLRSEGYKQGADFDFAYFPEKFDDTIFANKIQEIGRAHV